MMRLRIVFAFVAFFLWTVESLQIRKTLKLKQDKTSEFVGDKSELDGERKEVYEFFDRRFGQNEDDIRKEDFSPVQQPEESDEDPYDVVSNLITDAMEGEEDEGSEAEDVSIVKTSILSLVPVSLAHGATEEDRVPWKGESYVDLFGQGLSTSTPSTGAEVTLTRNDLSSKAEGSVRLFRTDGYSNRTCSPVDPTKVINAHCGNHYLFPGYSMRLVSSANCIWSFRHLSPEVVFLMKGTQLEEDVTFRVEEKLVTVSVKMITEANQRKLAPTKKLLREIVVISPETAGPAKISPGAEGLSNSSPGAEGLAKSSPGAEGLAKSSPGAEGPAKISPGAEGPAKISQAAGPAEADLVFDSEICVPSGPAEMLADYEGFETTCCSRSDLCGVSAVKNLVGQKLSMHAVPWEALLTVRGTPSSDTAETYCSGSLISSEWILTTASCFIRNGLLVGDDTDYVPEVIVAFGQTNDSVPVETHAVAEVHVFPTVSETHEIALVRLREPSFRMPVCLPAYRKPSPARNLFNRESYVFGWVVGDGNPYLSGLKQKVISSDKCSTQMGRRLPPHMVCTVDTPENRPCLADGDLLTMINNRYFLTGLSWPRLACVNDLRPHTSVAYFMNWITSVTGMAMPNPVHGGSSKFA